MPGNGNPFHRLYIFTGLIIALRLAAPAQQGGTASLLLQTFTSVSSIWHPGCKQLLAVTPFWRKISMDVQLAMGDLLQSCRS